MKSEDYRLQKILWSVVIALGLFLYIARIVNQTYSILGGFGFFVAGVIIFSPLGVLLLLLRLLGVLKKRDTFIYILVATILLTLGIYDFYLAFRATTTGDGLFALFVYSIPLLLAGCMFLDISFGGNKSIFSSTQKEKP